MDNNAGVHTPFIAESTSGELEYRVAPSLMGYPLYWYADHFRCLLPTHLTALISLAIVWQQEVADQEIQMQVTLNRLRDQTYMSK